MSKRSLVAPPMRCRAGKPREPCSPSMVLMLLPGRLSTHVNPQLVQSNDEAGKLARPMVSLRCPLSNSLSLG